VGIIPGGTELLIIIAAAVFFFGKDKVIAWVQDLKSVQAQTDIDSSGEAS